MFLIGLGNPELKFSQPAYTDTALVVVGAAYGCVDVCVGMVEVAYIVHVFGQFFQRSYFLYRRAGVGNSRQYEVAQP